MSVWSDIGIDGTGAFFGVLPGDFLREAYAFCGLLKSKLWAWNKQLPAYDFSFRPKIGDRDAFWTYDLDGYLSPVPTYFQQVLGRPVPAAAFASDPDWPGIFDLTDADLLGEAVLPFPFSHYGYSVMDPGWYKQRYKLYQLIRWVTVELEIKIRRYRNGEPEWETTEYIPGAREITRFNWGTPADPGTYPWTDRIEIAFPAYWQQADCKIGIEGRSIAGERETPLGSSWVDSQHYEYEYTGYLSPTQTLRIYGVADLATHPDFAQYFDIA